MKSIVLASLVAIGCGSSSANQPDEAKHGTLTDLSNTKSQDPTLCEHRVPRDVCTRHNPHLVAEFKSSGDWCGEHGVPESQCYECHPDLSFEPLPELPAGADVVKLSEKGEDPGALAALAVAGKVTVFDYYADWCAPCRKIDAHMFQKMQSRGDIALRKLNVVSWETPLAKSHLKNVAKLPYVVVYGRDGKEVRAITGFDLAALDAAIDEGAAR
jgi:thiol-disulfide isomerase/thioredoxin